MDSFAAARAAAIRWRGEAMRVAGEQADAKALVAAALGLAELAACPVADDDLSLCGAEAVLDRSAQAIFYKASVSDALACFEIAHELGHFWMEGESEPCHPIGFALLEEDALAFGATRIDGYGPKQRRECQANVFARTFLLPEEEARRQYLDGATAPAIAAALGLDENSSHRATYAGYVAAAGTGPSGGRSQPNRDQPRPRRKPADRRPRRAGTAAA